VSERLISPPLVDVADVGATIAAQGWAVVAAATLARLAAIPGGAPSFAPLQPSWAHLPKDGWLKDGGHYRSRRHSCFVVDNDDVAAVTHRAHWQSLDYNALHGGLERWFEPISDDVRASPVFLQLLRGLAALCSAQKGGQPWFVEAHQFRIDTHEGIGRPTPEGAHRDGVDFVVVTLIERHGIRGGETRVFAAAGNAGQRFTLSEPWSALILDDERVIHESTPIQSEATSALPGHRDTLVLTFRRGGFQGPG